MSETPRIQIALTKQSVHDDGRPSYDDGEEEETELFSSPSPTTAANPRRQRLLLDEKGSLEFPINVECT